MLDDIIKLDQDLLLKINHFSSPALDMIMLALSDKIIWIPLYLYLIWRLYQLYGKRIYIPLLAIALVILVADQTTSSILKPMTERLRPCKNMALAEHLRLITDCNGRFGFASSHAANTFGLAVLILKTGHMKPLGIMLLLWATLISYSRVYLAQHYPTDIIAGAGIGIMAAWLVGWVLIRYYPPITKG